LNYERILSNYVPRVTPLRLFTRLRLTRADRRNAMQVPEYERGVRAGTKFAVAWLHARANEMNDPWAKAVLNTAAFGLGLRGKEGSIEAKAKMLEIALARMADPAPH
jgi:hypothetical protein